MNRLKADKSTLDEQLESAWWNADPERFDRTTDKLRTLIGEKRESGLAQSQDPLGRNLHNQGRERIAIEDRQNAVRERPGGRTTRASLRSQPKPIPIRIIYLR
jgi:hypothetical protein